MNVNGGALDFELTASNDGLNAALDESKKRIQGFSNSAVQGGKAIDDFFGATTENIKIQKDVIKSLEAQLKELDGALEGIAPGKVKADLMKQSRDLKKELAGEVAVLAQLEKTTNQTESAQVSFRSQLMAARNELIKMEEAGQRNTEQYRKLQIRAGELKDAIADAGNQMKIVGADDAMFQGVLSGITGVSGAFSAAQGAVGMFAGENENLQKIMLKVQSLMAITIGLQEIQKMLDKDEAFRLVVVARAKEMLAAATNRVSVALGISNVAAQALMATLTLGLSVAIGAIIYLFDKWGSAQKVAAEDQKKFVEGVADSASKSLAEFGKLRAEWNQLGESLKAKKKFIDDNKDSFKELGVEVKNVHDAENLLVKNKDNFIQALMEKARATAAMDLAAESYKESMKKMSEAEDGVSGVVSANAMAVGSPAMGLWASYKNHSMNKDFEESGDLKKKGDKLILDAVGYQKKAADIMKKSGIKEYKEPGEKTDPFLEALDKRKAEYDKFLKWTNSSDIVLQTSAKREFAKMLKEGATYLDYLTKQRDALLALPERSKTQNSNLKKLNNAIAGEEKAGVLDSFDKDLQKQLDGAKSVLQMYAIIEEKKKLLNGDGTDLDKGKADLIKKAKDETDKKAKEETKALLQEYSAYLAEKLTFEETYDEKKKTLNLEKEKATTESEKQIAINALESLEKAKKKYSKQSGNEEYDTLAEKYRSFEKQRSDISKEFEDGRALAKLQKNDELLKQLNIAEKKALSELATQELTGSDVWANLFGNLDGMAASQIEILVKEIESKFSTLSKTMNPVDLDAIREKLNEAKAILIQDNPFGQIGASLKKIFTEGAKDGKDSAVKIKKEWQNLGNATESSFKFVEDAVSSCDILRDAIGEIGSTALASLASIAMASIAVATAIKTAEKASVVLAIIQAALVVVQAVLSVIKSITQAHDKNIDKSINNTKAAVEGLKNAYSDLERAITKALGGDTYKLQQEQIKNLQTQQALILQNKQAELSKKKTDGGKVSEYEQAYKEAGQKIEDIIGNIADSITQTSAKDLAGQLADALVTAYGKGEDAAKSFEEVSKNVMANAVKNALKLQFLEKPLQAAVDQLQKNMGSWQGDNFVFDGLTPEEQQQFKDQIKGIGTGFGEAMKQYDALFSDLGAAIPTTSLSGAIKGASQESIDLLSGQTNAVRVNQMEGLDLMRQQLFTLSNIDLKIASSNKYLENISSKINSSTDPLRPLGLKV